MRIAIVKLSALGDIVHAMVALQFIKQHRPDIEIDWIVEARFAGVLQNNPHISNVLPVEISRLKKNKLLFFKELRKIREYALNRYDLVIDAQGLLKSAIVARLLGKTIAGFDKHSIREKAAAYLYTSTFACAYDKNTVDRNAFILSAPLEFTILREDILSKQVFLFARDPNPALFDYFSRTEPNLLMIIGSSWETKNYPKEKFVHIARELGHNCLLAWGNAEEKSKAEWMAAQYDRINVLPKLDLNDLISAVAQADLVIGNDTGPTHMAWSLNKPSITIFGPTPVRQAYQTGINKVVKSPSSVNPYKLNRKDDSIKDIDPQEIVRIAKSLLDNRQTL